MRDTARGFALISALLLLLVITLLGVSLFLGVGLEQRATGNSLDKGRALQLAQSAVSVTQQWLRNMYTNDKTPIPTDCKDTTPNPTQFHVCASLPTTPDDPSTWSGVTQLSFSQVSVTTAGGSNGYWAKPGVRVTFLGNASMGPGRLYLIDAYAYGGNQNTLAAVQSVYYVGGSTLNTTPAQSLGK